MAILIQARWFSLIAALVGAALFVVGMFAPLLMQALPSDATLVAIVVLQALGVFAMSRHLQASGSRGGWATIVRYLSALLWLIVFVSAQMGVAAGPGGIVYGILITLPGIALGLSLQLAALFGFLAKAKAR